MDASVHLPTVGRIVHVYDRAMAAYPPTGIGPYAAIVTAVHSETEIDVSVFPMRSMGERIGVVKGVDADRIRVWWQWPERT